MKKINIIQKNIDFDRIIKKRNGVVNNDFIINTEVNDDNITKFGITFTKNLCNAVTRNKLKRQVKAIIDNNKKMYQNNRNYIIIIRKGALGKIYQDLEISLTSLFIKEKEKENEKIK